MKRNKLFLLGLFVVFAAVLSLSLVSSTFAKYTSTNSGNDTARVAKWGVTVTVDGKTFATAYDETVLSQTAENVVAPGTAGNFAGIAVTGTPEVSVQVTYASTFSLGTNWVDGAGDYYCPISVFVNGVEFKGMSYTSASEFEDAVEAAINAKGQAYAKGTDLSAVNDDLVISWQWLLTGGLNQTDAKDSYLGDLATTANAPTLFLEVSVRIDQVE